VSSQFLIEEDDKPQKELNRLDLFNIFCEWLMLYVHKEWVFYGYFLEDFLTKSQRGNKIKNLSKRYSPFPF
jgi:hypothetical protein